MEEKETFTEKILGNIRKIMADKDLKQVVMANYIQTSASQFSKILNGEVQLSLKQISNLAIALKMREIDIITYPDKYVSNSESISEDTEAILQIKLRKDKKEQVLKLIFGENNIEILNK